MAGCIHPTAATAGCTCHATAGCIHATAGSYRVAADTDPARRASADAGHPAEDTRDAIRCSEAAARRADTCGCRTCSDTDRGSAGRDTPDDLRCTGCCAKRRRDRVTSTAPRSPCSDRGTADAIRSPWPTDHAKATPNFHARDRDRAIARRRIASASRDLRASSSERTAGCLDDRERHRADAMDASRRSRRRTANRPSPDPTCNRGSTPSRHRRSPSCRSGTGATPSSSRSYRSNHSRSRPMNRRSHKV